MNKLASSLASKVRVTKNIIRPAKNSIRLVGSRLSWGRNYISGSEEIPYNDKLISRPIGKRRWKTRLEYIQAMKVDWGFVSPSFITNRNSATCMLTNPFILIYANKILTEDVVKQAIRPRRPLLIVAEDVETELVRSLRRSYRGKSKLCVVKPPKCEHNGKAIMQDLAVFTGGQVVTGESDMNFVPQMLGSCKEVKVSLDEMVIIGGSGGHEDIEERRKELKFSIMSSTSNDELKLLEERLAKFSCEVAYFKVGGDSCAEVFKYCCRVYNAITASLAALDGGIVAGGGVALLHASKELEKLHTSWYNEKEGNNWMLGVHIVQKALKAPVCSIAHAAGFDYSVVVEKLLEQDNPDLGYDPAKGEFIDLIECGNVDAALLVGFELNDVAWHSNCNFGTRCLELQSSKGTQTEKEACDLANECSLA